MMDIDLVYLWVNGNDPQWIARRNACIGKPSGRQENCEARFADSGELKYSLRSVEKYAPWVRNIFIVTDNQKPQWLDTSNSRIHIVDHTQIMPSESLPCYNSALIEHFLHNIPGLAEHFLYANDDTYLNQQVTPQTFFTEEGMPKVYMFHKRLRKQSMLFLRFFKERILRKKLNLNMLAIDNAARLVERKYGTYYNCTPHHNIDGYLKSTFVHANRIFGRELSSTYSNHMRSHDDIHRCLYSFIDIAEKRGELHLVTLRHSFRLHVQQRESYQLFEQYNPLFFCMNDSEHATDDDRRYSIEYLDRLFPEKSQFEK